MTAKQKANVYLFILVSIAILITGSCFIVINYFGDWKHLRQGEQQRAQDVEKAFRLALDTTATNIQQIATMVANDPHIQELFLQAKEAIDKEGGGKGGAESARLRQELYNHLKTSWKEMTARYDARQLHFHFGPGSLSFLRVHKPDTFGDTMHDIRFIVADANEKKLPTKGFETGRVYAGIRGVVPVFAEEPGSGKRVHVGVLEAGTSFENVFQNLSRTFGTHFALLLTKEHVEKTMWPHAVEQRFPDGPIDGWYVEVGDEEAEALLALPRVLEGVRRGQSGSVYLQDSQPPLLVDFFPLRDYRGEKENLEPVARVLEWVDISEGMQELHAALRTNIVYGLSGFLLVEVLLVLAWRYASSGLDAVIKRRTLELERASKMLRAEVRERINAEQALRERAAQYKAMFDDNSCVMILVDPETGRIVQANAAAARFYGYDISRLEQMEIFEINILSREAALRAMQKTEAAVSVRHEFTHRLANGEERVVDVHSGPIVFQGRRLLFSIIHDITVAHRMGKQLKDALGELEAIFENSQVAVVLLKGERKIARVNQCFYDILGYETGEVVGESVEILHLSEEKFREFGELYYESLVHGIRRQIEFPLRRKDGTAVWCLISGKALAPPDLEKGVIWVAADISKLKKAEQLREDVQHIMRHDLKTPLNAIMSVPQLLRYDERIEGELLELVDLLEVSARRMLSIIDLSLDMLKMESGSYVLQPVPLNLVKILDEVRDELREVEQRKALQFSCRLDDAPLAEGASIMVLGEERLCYAVVANLLRNAYEASPQGGEVGVRCFREGTNVRMEMTNSGVVHESLREKFFEKYATFGKSGGTGLGTYAARLSAEVQGGSIHMSCDDTSTTLTVVLPAAS